MYFKLSNLMFYNFLGSFFFFFQVLPETILTFYWPKALRINMVPTDEADEFYQVMKKIVFIVLAFGPSFFSGNNLGVDCFIVYFFSGKNKKSHCIKRAKTESPVHRLCIRKICVASEKYINLEIPLSR